MDVRTRRALLPRRCLALALAGLLGLIACVHPDRRWPVPVSRAWDLPGHTELGRDAQTRLAGLGGASAFHVLDEGPEAFAARALMIDAAQATIDLQVYIYQNDVTGRLLLARLLTAADRGVRVRMLLDDLGSSGLDPVLGAIDRHPHIEVRLFNPLARGPLPGVARAFDLAWRPRALNRRMHNKMLAADGAVAIVGGRNVGDAYFGAGELVNFADLDLLTLGPVLPALGASFDAYWASELAVPVAAWPSLRGDAGSLPKLRQALRAEAIEQWESPWARSMRGSDLVEEMVEGRIAYTTAPARVVADPPWKARVEVDRNPAFVAAQLGRIFRLVDDSLEIVSPYFVPGREFTDWLAALAESGVRVRILTNSLAATDVAVVHSGYQKYRRDLVAAGVEIHEIQPSGNVSRRRGGTVSGRAGSGSSASLHSKALSFDRDTVFVGSMNVDPRSVRLNTELGLLVEGRPLADGFVEDFDRLAAPDVSWRLALGPDGGLRWHGEEDGRPEAYAADPETGWWKRLRVRMLGWLPIEDQL